MVHNDKYVCPLAIVDRRLEDVHRAWHDAENAYFDPERFRFSVQSTIQILRTVTFVLQNHKKLFACPNKQHGILNPKDWNSGGANWNSRIAFSVFERRKSVAWPAGL